ncbi:hypothetical protein G9A89_014857 [Geosiphon pyriformis]|nr:hypothetical protein G9A89_014857 [Geosiphon pyriformis]
MGVCHYCATPSELHIYDTAANLSTTSISSANLSTDNTDNLLAINTIHLSAAVHQLILSSSTQPNSNAQNYLSILVTPEDAQPNNLETKQQSTLTSNILLATITENKTLNTIFPFKLKETTPVLLFSGTVLNTKPITAMYTNVKVDGHSIKLILNIDCTASTRIITANGATKTPIGEIDNFFFKVNGIIIFIKVLALVRNNWLSKTNAILDWIMQKLQLSQNTTYSHFKSINLTAPLIEFEKEEKKPTWEAYQVFWTNTEHNKLLSVPLWDDNSKGKQSKELTWKKEDKKGKGKRKEEEPTTDSKPTYNSYTTPHQSTYCCPKLVCINCDKKLSSIGACCGNDKEYTLTMKFYCHPCIIECFERPKRIGK